MRRCGRELQERLRSGLEINAVQTGVTEGGAAFQAINQCDVGLPGADTASSPAATASQREESEKSCPAVRKF